MCTSCVGRGCLVDITALKLIGWAQLEVSRAASFFERVQASINLSIPSYWMSHPECIKCVERSRGVPENSCPIHLVLLTLEARYDCPTLRWRYISCTCATSRLKDRSFTRPIDLPQCRVFRRYFHCNLHISSPNPLLFLVVYDFQLFTVLYCPYCTIADCDCSRPLRQYYHFKSRVQTRTLEVLHSAAS